MNRLRSFLSIVSMALLLRASAALAADDPFAGTFRGDTVTVEIAPTAAGYGGTINLATQRFPLTATAATGQLRGTFTSDGHPFDFTLTRDGDRFTLRSGTAVYALSRVGGASPVADNHAAAAAAAGQKENFIRLTPVNVLDPLSNNQPAMTVLIPSDWKLEGGIVWRWNAFYPTAVQARIYNPKGLEQAAYYPSLLFTDGVRESVWQSSIIAGPEIAQKAVAAWPDGAVYMGFELQKRLQDPAAVLREYVLPRYRKDLVGLRPVSVKDLPDVAKAAADQYAGVQGVETKAAVVRFTYDVQGTPVEEDFLCTLVAVPTLPPMVSWGMEIRSYRAKKGELDKTMRLFQAIDQSAKLDLKWYAGVCSVQQMMQDGIRQSIENAGRLSKYIAKRNDEITQIIREGYENRQRAQDKMFDAFDRVIRGVEQYKDPGSNHPLELPLGYEHAYMSPRGEIIMSNGGFNPGQEFHEDWRELPKTKQ